MSNRSEQMCQTTRDKARSRLGPDLGISPCFTPGTQLATQHGEISVEKLRVGDKVVTRDNGLQEVRWIGRAPMFAQDFRAAPHLLPILIRQGALGRGLPESDLLVSPNHRILVASDRTSLLFNEPEVLVAAKHLSNGSSIQTVASSGTTYIHLLFDRHEVVLSNGAWSESFEPNDQSLKAVGNAQRLEIFELFPALKAQCDDKPFRPLRPLRRILARKRSQRPVELRFQGDSPDSAASCLPGEPSGRCFD